MDKQAYMKMMTGGLIKTAGPRSAGRRFPGLENKNLRVLGRQAYNRSVSLPAALNGDPRGRLQAIRNVLENTNRGTIRGVLYNPGKFRSAAQLKKYYKQHYKDYGQYGPVEANKRKYNEAASKIIGERNVLKRLSRDQLGEVIPESSIDGRIQPRQNRPAEKIQGTMLPVLSSQSARNQTARQRVLKNIASGKKRDATLQGMAAQYSLARRGQSPVSRADKRKNPPAVNTTAQDPMAVVPYRRGAVESYTYNPEVVNQGGRGNKQRTARQQIIDVTPEYSGAEGARSSKQQTNSQAGRSARQTVNREEGRQQQSTPTSLISRLSPKALALLTGIGGAGAGALGGSLIGHSTGQASGKQQANQQWQNSSSFWINILNWLNQLFGGSGSYGYNPNINTKGK